MTATEARRWVVPIPGLTAPPLTLNQRMHWAKEYTLRWQLKDAVHAIAALMSAPKGLDRVHIELHWRPAIARRRDTDNPTPTLKACIDALVRYGLVVDDDSEHVTSAIVIHPAAKPAKLWLEITEVTE